MSQKIASLHAEISADTKGLKKGLKETKTGLEKAKSGFASAAKGAAIFAAAAVATGVAVKKAFEFAQEGANIQRLENSFLDLSGSVDISSSKILSALRKASQGTVANSDIILASNRAMMLGLGKDADQLASLMEVAAFRGRAMGLSTTQAFNDIVTGIGRASPLILDNLGIVVDTVQVYDDFAVSIGKTATQLTKAEKTQALLNSVVDTGNAMMEKAGGLAKDNAAEYEKLTARIKNQTDALKKSVSDGFTPLIKKMNERDAVFARTTELVKEGLKLSEAQTQAANEQEQAIKELAGTQSTELVKSYIAAGEAAMNYTKGTIANQKASTGLIKEVYASSAAIEDLRKEEEKLNKALKDGKISLDEYGDAQNELTADFEKATNARILKRAEELLAEDGLTQEEELLLIARAVAMGVLDDAAATHATNMINEAYRMQRGINAEIDKIQSTKLTTWSMTMEQVQQPIVRLTGGGYNPAYSYSSGQTSPSRGGAPTRGGRARAAGGAFSAGDTFLAGENGPELITSDRSGSILSNSQLRSGASGGASDGLMREMMSNMLTEEGMARIMEDALAGLIQ